MQWSLIPDILFSNSYMDERRITVMTFPLISFRVTGPNSRLSFPPVRLSDPLFPLSSIHKQFPVPERPPCILLIQVFYLLPNRCRLDAVESLLKPHLLDVLCYIFQCPGRHTSSLSLRLFLSSFALGSLLRFPLPSPAPS